MSKPAKVLFLQRIRSSKQIPNVLRECMRELSENKKSKVIIHGRCGNKGYFDVANVTSSGLIWSVGDLYKSLPYVGSILDKSLIYSRKSTMYRQIRRHYKTLLRLGFEINVAVYEA